MPTVTKNLIIINVLVFFGTLVAQRYGIDLTNYLGLHFFLASDFNPAQLITYMFMHGGFSHIFFNMFAVFMFGTVLERTWGPKRFLFYYIACGIGAGLIQEGVQIYSRLQPLFTSGYRNGNYSYGRVFEHADHRGRFGSCICHFARIRYVVPQQPAIHLSAALPYQS